MRPSLWPVALVASACLAQGDLAALLASQDDLSTLLELVGLVDGLADTLSAASNITIVAPTNQAFANVPRDIPEGVAIEYRNDSISVGALLANHVFKGVYPSNVITDIPTFAQTLLDDSYITPNQPFSNFTGGAYNGLVKNGNDVCILSGEQTISTVTEAVRIFLSTSSIVLTHQTGHQTGPRNHHPQSRHRPFLWRSPRTLHLPRRLPCLWRSHRGCESKHRIRPDWRRRERPQHLRLHRLRAH